MRRGSARAQESWSLGVSLIPHRQGRRAAPMYDKYENTGGPQTLGNDLSAAFLTGIGRSVFAIRY
jgi:hypothetical protein